MPTWHAEQLGLAPQSLSRMAHSTVVELDKYTTIICGMCPPLLHTLYVGIPIHLVFLAQDDIRNYLNDLQGCIV